MTNEVHTTTKLVKRKHSRKRYCWLCPIDSTLKGAALQDPEREGMLLCSRHYMRYKQRKEALYKQFVTESQQESSRVTLRENSKKSMERPDNKLTSVNGGK